MNPLCPICQSPINETDRVFECSNRSFPAQPGDCKFVIFKDNLKALGKPKLTAKELAKLVIGEPISLKLKSIKNGGKPFECLGELEPRGNAFGIKLVFTQRPEPKPVVVPDGAEKSTTEDEAPDFETFEMEEV